MHRCTLILNTIWWSLRMNNGNVVCKENMLEIVRCPSEEKETNE